MAVPTLNILFSLEVEKERVINTLNKSSWYHENGYNPRYPGGLRLKEISELPSRESLLATLEVEYDSSFYESTTLNVHAAWNEFVRSWPESTISQTTLIFQNAYDVYLTRYGVGGSYNPSNTIVLNIGSGNVDSIAKVLFHEMIHLCIEPLVQKHNTPHWYKERIVDLTFKKLMPEIAFEQNLPKEALAVDAHFAQHYGDFDVLFSSIENKKV